MIEPEEVLDALDARAEMESDDLSELELTVAEQIALGRCPRVGACIG